MSFLSVAEEYIKAIANQGKRRTRQGRDFFTRNENKALKFYADALTAASLGKDTILRVGGKDEKGQAQLKVIFIDRIPSAPLVY